MRVMAPPLRHFLSVQKERDVQSPPRRPHRARPHRAGGDGVRLNSEPNLKSIVSFCQSLPPPGLIAVQPHRKEETNKYILSNKPSGRANDA